MALTAPNAVENRYKRGMRGLMRLISAGIEGIDNPPTILAQIRRIVDSRAYRAACAAQAVKMATMVHKGTLADWRAAARQSSRGREIFEALSNEMNDLTTNSEMSQIVQRNAELIRSIPSTVAADIAGQLSRDVVSTVQERSYEGMRAADIAGELRKRFPAAARANIDLIARTEVSKATTSLTEVRSKRLGIRWYIWRTSEDSRVRASHAHMSDVLVPWGAAPNPEALIGKKSSLGAYHAGNAPNCRCYPEPVVELDFVTWPHKVLHNGKIQTMTRAQFDKLTE